jgi:hypothetical protein
MLNRKDFLKTTFGVVLASLLPVKTLAETKLPMTNWMGTPCAQLPDITRTSLSQEALADAYKAIMDRNYGVAWAFLNKWDLTQMENYWDIDHETHRELHHVGIRGYLWGVGLIATLMVPRGTIWLLSANYEPHEKPVPALLQKLVLTKPYDFVAEQKDGYIYRREYNVHYEPLGVRITRYRDGRHEMSFDGGITWL